MVAETRLILIASDERRAVQRSIFFFLPPSSFIPLRFYYSRACYDVRGTRRERDLLFAPHGSRIRHTGLMVNRIIVQFAYNSIRFLLLIKFFAAQNRGAIGRIVMYSLSTLSFSLFELLNGRSRLPPPSYLWTQSAEESASALFWRNRISI